MKSIKIILAISAITLAGCSKDWLDIDPVGKKFESNFYKTEDEIKQGLIAAYSMLQPKYFSGWSSYYLLAGFPSDDSEVVGGGPNDRPEYTEINEYRTLSTNTAVLQLWRRNYYGINRANVVLENANPDASERSREYVAEAKFLRAYFYFELVKFFGDVPLITKSLTPDEYNQKRVPAKQVYDLIISDLTDAIPQLTSKQELSIADNYRATSGAAYALLGKAYLYMASPYYYSKYGFDKSRDELYTLAAQQFTQLETMGYDLEPNYDDIWHMKGEHGVESIFEIEYGNLERGGDWGNGRINGGNIDVQLCGPRGISTDTLNAGWGFDMVSQDLIAAYNAEGDIVRRDGTAYGEDFLTSIGASGWEKNQGYTGWFSKKRAPWIYATSLAAAEWNYETNERMLRYADVLLMMAEALLESGSGDPLPYINRVRERAQLQPLTSVTMDDIKKERRLEMAMEGSRFFDVVRWGDAATVFGPAGFTSGKHEVYPIPQDEIINSQYTLSQNDKY